MARPRLLAVVAAVGLAVIAVGRHLGRRGRGIHAPGGVLIADAASYDTLTGLLLRSFYDAVAADVGTSVHPGARVLEVGCGPGRLATRLASRGLNVTGLDLDPAMIERARRSADRGGFTPGAAPSFVVGDAAALPFDDAQFDAVVSTLSAHHWSDPVAGIREISRVLKPEGTAFLWDLRPGKVPLHSGLPGAIEAVRAVPVRIVGVRPWPWPWRLRWTERIEFVPAPRSSTQASSR